MVRITEFGADTTDATRVAIERIFFVSSGRTKFGDATERAAFCERWLGRYLLHDREHAFVASDMARAGAIAGYLVGSLADPAATARFHDISYFAEHADLTARYPAHLHINLDPAWRGQGIGARLIERFSYHAGRRGARGVHVVTGAGSRNVGFYRKCGFEPLREATWNSAEIVFLGRDLGARPGIWI